MIFLSHQSNDKEFVGDIAVTMREVFGEENVFFDSWSIKPGENIIGEMSAGLEQCKYFFFFITDNSLKSEMVKLEWTSALMRRANRDIKFIPVRAENVEVPMVISSLKYLDLYNHGLEVVKTQMIEIVSGEEKEKNFPVFKNLQAYVLQEEKNKLRFFVTVKRFFEPNSKFLIITTLKENEAHFGLTGGGMFRYGFTPNVGESNGEVTNAFLVDLEGGVKKGFKTDLSFTKKVDKPAYIGLYHLKSESDIEMIPTLPISSVKEILGL